MLGENPPAFFDTTRSAYKTTLLLLLLVFVFRGNVFTELLPRNRKGIHTQTHRLIGVNYGIRPGDGLSCHDIHKDWLRHYATSRKVMGSTPNDAIGIFN
jgi:hypothetical protein